MKTKKILVAVFMAMLICFGTAIPFLSGLNVANANETPPTVQSGSLYYFSDSPTILMDADLQAICGDVTFTKEVRGAMWEEQFADLVTSNYFDNFYNCYVIIEIKVFMPDPAVLKDLFERLKDQDCTTIFVCPYAASEFSDADFNNFVDYYFICTNPIAVMIDIAFADIVLHRDGWVDAVIIIDSRFINIANSGGDLQTIYDNSPYFRFLIDKFKQVFGFAEDDDIAGIWSVIESLNIKFLLHDGNNAYIDIDSGASYQDILIRDDIWDALGYNCPIYAMGVTTLPPDMYDFVSTSQHAGNYVFVFDRLPTYLVVKEPVVFGSNAPVIWAAGEDGSYIYNGDVMELMAMLSEIFNDNDNND